MLHIWFVNKIEIGLEIKSADFSMLKGKVERRIKDLQKIK